MASLMKLLFDTMPLAGVRHAVVREGREGQHFPGEVSFESKPISALTVRAWSYRDDEAHLMSADDGPLSAAKRTLPHSQRPVWSFDASTTPVNVIGNISCRTAEENYRKSRVLDELAFGIDDDGLLLPEVEVDLGRWGKRRLPLDETALVATIFTRDGSADDTCPSLWPVPANHQYGLLRVFVFDIDPVTRDVIVAKALQDSELDVFRAQCERLRRNAEQTGAVEELFADDAWPDGETTDALSSRVVDEFEAAVAAAVAAGDEATLARLEAELAATLSEAGFSAPELAASAQMTEIIGALEGLKVVRMVPHRIVVCCFLSLHFVSDDYTPMRPAWAARLYPVIMMKSTRPLDGFRAAMSFRRPATTTIDDQPGADCQCHEMNPTLDTLLVSDANPGDEQQISVNVPSPFGWWLSLGVPFPAIQGAPPLTFWDVIFAYTLPNAFDALAVKRYLMVHDEKDPGGNEKILRGAIRFDEVARDVHRMRRQGAFDNVHVAPSMRLKNNLVRIELLRGQVPIGSADLRAADRNQWRFNDITMAPICAHDCFHMHWRWSRTYVTPMDHTARGWGGAGVCGRPYTEAGQPLIPKNQELSVRLLSKTSFVYEAKALRVEADAWQVICHHGAGYVVETGSTVNLGRLAQDALADRGVTPILTALEPLDKSKPANDPFNAVRELPLSAAELWALFYWRNRFTIRPEKNVDGPIERTEINDLAAVLTGRPSRGR
jgi:hypothetical protein